MVKLVIEISEKEKRALRKSGDEVKKFFRTIKNAFQVRVVPEQAPKKRKRKK